MTDAFTSSAAVLNAILRLNSQAALLAVFVTIICLLCRKWLAPRWKSMLWMLVFLRMCLPVGPPFSFSLTNLIPSAGTETVHVAAPAAADRVPRLEPSPVFLEPGVVTPPEPAGIEPMAHSPAIASYWSLRNVLTLAWLAVAIVLLVRLGWLCIALGRQLSGLSGISDSAIISLAETSAQDARLSRVPRLLWALEGGSPAVLGWWRPILLLPRNSATLNHQQLRTVLLHEFHHVKSGDTLLAWLPRALCALFWFNPLLWWASRRWHEEREMACDEWVLRQIGPEGKRSYLETLVAIATNSQQAPSLVFTASIVSSPTLLERRILAMKRYRKPGWKGMAAGALLVLITGIVGLTDRIRAEVTAAPDDSVTDAASDNPAPAAADDADADKAPAQAQPKALHPNIIFARHVILWEGREIVTAEQLKQRLADMRAQQPVTPNAYFSLGFSFKNMNAAQDEKDQNEALNRGMLDALELIGGQDQWNMLSFVERRGSAVFDRIETADDLTPDPAEKLTGRVLLPGGTDPAVGAQIVILPVGEPCSLYLRNGKLRDPLDEICYLTDDQGVFEAYWGSLEFDQKLLIGDGTYNTVILHEQGYLVINGQLASENALYELLPWKNVTITTPDWEEGVSAEIWVKPAGAGKGIPGLSLAWPGPNSRVAVRAPLGNGQATYVVDSRAIDFNQPIAITADSPAEFALPDIPADR
jgi:beta-lactamase regulating signal transducer with metallopeptidase domain